MIGGDYKPQNDFNFKQKTKILRYLYVKNDELKMTYSKKTGIAQKGEGDDDFILSKKDINMEKIEAKNNLKYLQKLNLYNRIAFVSEIAEVQNRIRICGFIWGAAFASLFWGTIFRNFSMVKKIAFFVTSVHVGGNFYFFFFSSPILRTRHSKIRIFHPGYKFYFIIAFSLIN